MELKDEKDVGVFFVDAVFICIFSYDSGFICAES
jgi:hypothetical protein